MTEQQASIQQRSTIVVPTSIVERSILSYEHDLLDGRGGIDLITRKREYLKEARPTPEEHIRRHEESGEITEGAPLICITMRNAHNNPRCPIWSREHGICQNVDEDVAGSERPYYVLGISREGRFSASKIQHPNIAPDGVDFWAAGIPVLWDSEVVGGDVFGPELGDFCHRWAFKRGGDHDMTADSKAIYSRMSDVYREHQNSPAELAARAIDAVAPNLPRDVGYLHHAIGIDAAGSLVDVLANGSIESLGALAKEAGCTHAMIFENGGSCQVAIRKPGGELEPIFRSFYWRPPSIAVLIVEFKEGSARGRLPMAATGSLFARTQQLKALGQVDVTYETLSGSVRRTISGAGSDALSADLVARKIAGFSVTHGAASAVLNAPAEFVADVLECYRNRFCVLPRYRDPDGIRGLWLDNYLKSVYDRPFTISSSVEKKQRLGSRTMVRYDDIAVELSIGLDFGGTKIKAAVSKNGEEPTGREIKVNTRPAKPEDPDQRKERYTVEFLSQQINEVVDQACAEAGIEKSQLGALGISWVGAIVDGRAAGSKNLLDLDGMCSASKFNAELYEEVRNIGDWVPAQLELDCGRVAVFNDGEVEIVHAAQKLGLKNAALFKLGSSVAGAYIDSEGRSDYLMEVGRVVIDNLHDAMRHGRNKIPGQSSALVGSWAFAELGNGLGLETVEGGKISRSDAGDEFGAVIARGGEPAKLARKILRDMGKNLGRTILECIEHLPRIDHILVRGGLAGDHEVGATIREGLEDFLPQDVHGRIYDEKPSQQSGAAAAAVLASRARSEN